MSIQREFFHEGKHKQVVSTEVRQVVSAPLSTYVTSLQYTRVSRNPRRFIARANML